MMLNPIKSSADIKEEFISYVATRFHIADKTYSQGFIAELNKVGNIAKGPYLDINDSFKTGKTISELIGEGEMSPLFNELEPDKDEIDKEIKLERPLYLHQEEAVRKINQKHNLVVTTGTGSGKTECFILPILNHLLQEKERGELGSGVRAIIIYPMNALAVDQMKRLRDILADYPSITFGVYNGSTAYSYEQGKNEYGEIYKDDKGHALEPLPNEIISRDIMQKEPPHILVTNYAMLEYMMLRPKDDKVFSGAKLKFLILDEAHVYRGATGMETSLLLRRLKARISNPKDVRHILTSATLGGKESNDDIVRFAETLCAAKFLTDDIIRSQQQMPKFSDKLQEFPMELFSDLAAANDSLDNILKKYNVDFNSAATEAEILFDLCRSSALYKTLRECANKPLTINQLTKLVNEKTSYTEVTAKDIVNLITIAAKAEKGKTVLLKARYHMFIRALEGAYITVGPEKNIFLKRIKQTSDGKLRVFEAIICKDCGRIGVMGKVTNDNILVNDDLTKDDKPFVHNQKDKVKRYFLLQEKDETWTNHIIDDDDNDGDDDNEVQIGENDYILCAKCGKIIHKSQQRKLKCSCGNKYAVPVREAIKSTTNSKHKCPACNSWNLNTFYLGYDAATSVLATELYEQLPETEQTIKKAKPPEPANDDLFSTDTTDVGNITITTKARQFLSFSDSRSDAAFFACSLTNSYREFLRRRGIWHVVEKNKAGLSKNPWEIKTFVDELTAYFDTERTFAEPGDKGSANLTPISRRQAWIAVLNEMVNGRRNTSLASLGVLDFTYKGCNPNMMQNIATHYKKSPADIEALFNLLVMDIITSGAVKSEEISLNDVEREYIYYTTVEKRFIRQKNKADTKKSYLSGWLPTMRDNGKNHPNSRLIRTMRALGLNENEEEAIKFLGGVWDRVLIGGTYPLSGNEEYYISTDKLQIRAGMGALPVYKCDKCGHITMKNCQNSCISVRCNGKLKEISYEELFANNHFARLYSGNKMKPLHIKEHTAQLGREEQQHYQQMFVKKELNALSCSTTFEMGVDVGSLETVYLRDMPPTPANYVQRAGRAGRSRHSAAYALTYAKLSSHDFTYFEHPERMISGKIGVPVFSISNEKIVSRHIFAIALSNFFSLYPEVYDNNNANNLLNGNGYEELTSYLEGHPEELKELLILSIPENMHSVSGISIPDWGWVDSLIGKEGVLKIAVTDFRDTVEWYEKEIKRLKKDNDIQTAARFERQLKEYRRGEKDGLRPNQLIEFLVRNNVLPKYGFPVDTVELYQTSGEHNVKTRKNLQMIRDLQLAIGEYAPGSQVVADGWLYTSRYIRKLPNSRGHDWEEVYIAKCENCQTWNYSRSAPEKTGEKCVSCQEPLKKWQKAIEPRKGFAADSNVKEVPIKKPEKLFKSDDYYIGDPQRHVTYKQTFELSNGLKLQTETSTNDSLMVMCNEQFFVCDKCGFAVSVKLTKESDEKEFSSHARNYEKKHNNAWGRECTNNKLYPRKLCHVFKTDVIKIIFGATDAGGDSVMLSVMYALLEAMSDVLDIERNDIKGCLHQIRYQHRLINAVILYDAVAGGAGHVRRLATDDGKVLQKVITKAINITENCDCDPSCYSCLRNYYNQAVHERLNRHAAAHFLKLFQGDMSVCNNEDF